jgi:LysM repeat protein
MTNPIDPLLNRQHATQHTTQQPTQNPAQQPAQQIATTMGRRPDSTRRALRIGGAAGACSLLAMTGYITFGATGSSAGAAAPADTVPPSVAEPASTPAGQVAALALAPAATIAASTTTGPPTVVVEPCTNTYTVMAGDSWSLIAGEASVAISDVYAANNASALTALYPDQIVCLPSGAVVVTTTAAPVTTSAPVVTAAPVVTQAAPVATAAPARPKKKASSSSATS